MRSFLGRVAIAALVIVPVVPAITRAQSSSTSAGPRGPIWAALSAGRGDLQFNCEICRHTDQSSWAADLSIGSWANAHTAFGGELGAWRLSGKDATQRVLTLSAISQLYPFQKMAAFVRLGIGLMSYHSSDGEQALTARSLALQAGFGYDVAVTARYVAVPFVGLVQGFNNGLYLDGAKVTDASQMKLVRFGLGVGVGR